MTLILYKLLRGVNPRPSGTGRGVLQRLDLVVHVLPERIVDHGLETPTAGGVGAGPDPLRDMRPGCRPGWPRSWARRWRRRPKYLLEPIGSRTNRRPAQAAVLPYQGRIRRLDRRFRGGGRLTPPSRPPRPGPSFPAIHGWPAGRAPGASRHGAPPGRLGYGCRPAPGRTQSPRGPDAPGRPGPTGDRRTARRGGLGGPGPLRVYGGRDPVHQRLGAGVPLLRRRTGRSVRRSAFAEAARGQGSACGASRPRDSRRGPLSRMVPTRAVGKPMPTLVPFGRNGRRARARPACSGTWRRAGHPAPPRPWAPGSPCPAPHLPWPGG
jgi:hypothetical protein